MKTMQKQNTDMHEQSRRAKSSRQVLKNKSVVWPGGMWLLKKTKLFVFACKLAKFTTVKNVSQNMRVEDVMDKDTSYRVLALIFRCIYWKCAAERGPGCELSWPTGTKYVALLAGRTNTHLHLIHPEDVNIQWIYIVFIHLVLFVRMSSQQLKVCAFNSYYELFLTTRDRNCRRSGVDWY